MTKPFPGRLNLCSPIDVMRTPLATACLLGASLAATAAALRAPMPRTEWPGPAATTSRCVPWDQVRLCQALGPAAPHPIWGVDGTAGAGRGEPGWESRGHVNWQAYAQGEYVGHARTAHVPEYRIRVDDKVSFVFRLTRESHDGPYALQVGDTIRVESLTGDAAGGGSADGGQDNIRRELIIQPDGTISLPLLGQGRAAHLTVDALRLQLEERYKKFYKVPAITVTPILFNTRLQDLIDSVDARQGASGGLRLETTINPDGRIYLPALGAVCAQGLTLDELQMELNAPYRAMIPGVEITPVLTQRAPRNVFVLGEVRTAGRYSLDGPTSLMGAISMAGGWIPGANLRQVVVFRRGDDWRLMATMLDIQGALYARRPAPADEIWLNGGDIVVVPKAPILVVNEFINQFFTNGLYAMFPQFSFGNFNFNNFRSISN